MTNTRRILIKLLGTAAGVSALPLPVFSQEKQDPIQKRIPSTGEALTVIGMGTWLTFNVGSDMRLRDQRTEVLHAFFAGGGQLVDSSPMYGSSQEVLGYALDKLGRPKQLFSAEKVWTINGNATREHISEIAKAWKLKRFDLMQVHNLLSWQQHLDTLETMKEAGELRYVGVTTSHGRRHQELEQIMKSRPLDFVQLTYNIEDRWVEDRLLPLAKEKGIAVIANRPFGGGTLVDHFQRNNKPLPPWAKEFGCENWPQLLLKFIVSHPAVTCAIPATTKTEHMEENMGAARGVLPDEKMRRQMLDYVRGL